MACHYAKFQGSLKGQPELRVNWQVSNQIRGLMKTFGLVVPKGAGSVFERNVLTLLEGEDDLARIILPLLKAWSDIRLRVAELTKQLVTMARDEHVAHLGPGAEGAAWFQASSGCPRAQIGCNHARDAEDRRAV